MDPICALDACGGVARFAGLRERGVSERALRAAVEAGAVARPSPGTYALPTAPVELVTAVRLGGVASHCTAARLHGLEGWRPPAALHVIVPWGSRPRAEGVTVHRCNLPPIDVDPHRPTTALLRTLLDCGRTLPLPEAVVLLDAALRGRTVRFATLRAAADAARGHGATALRRAVAHADALSASALESVLRLILDLTGTRIESQARIDGVGHVDFLLDGWLVVEADGFAFHAERASYQEDRRRATVLAAHGYGLLRFSWEDVRFRPGWVLAQVMRVLERGTPQALDQGCAG